MAGRPSHASKDPTPVPGASWDPEPIGCTRDCVRHGGGSPGVFLPECLCSECCAAGLDVHGGDSARSLHQADEDQAPNVIEGRSGGALAEYALANGVQRVAPESCRLAVDPGHCFPVHPVASQPRLSLHGLGAPRFDRLEHISRHRSVSRAHRRDTPSLSAHRQLLAGRRQPHGRAQLGRGCAGPPLLPAGTDARHPRSLWHRRPRRRVGVCGGRPGVLLRGQACAERIRALSPVRGQLRSGADMGRVRRDW
mmetsp:Transcript_24470/g.56591  ORF Transcript_24470/g.56591 Transcript_24470/m.56591 type:complete len:252 (-) Transcript_24470:4715-5470(-)